MPLPPDELPPPPEINLLPGRTPRAADTGAGSSVTFSGCVLHYTCDDTVTTDSSGNNNTGILTGSGTVLSLGLINNKLTFNGSGYIAFTSTALLGLASNTSAISSCCWVKTIGGNAGPILTLYDGSNNGILFVVGWNGYEGNFSGSPSFRITSAAGGLTHFTAPTAINDGNWHHVAFTRNSSQLVTIYIDGVVSGTPTTDTITGGITSSVSQSAIVRNAGDTSTFVGSIDDFQIYNRALTPAEITSIYNGGIPAAAAYVLPAVPGAFTLTGIAAALPRTYVMPATAGSFAFTGVAANLVYASLTNYVLVCGTGQFNFIGYSVGSPGQGLGISGGLGMPVVTVLSGGIPVVDVSSLGLNAGVPVSEAAPGRGIPVTKVSKFGTPVVYI